MVAKRTVGANERHYDNIVYQRLRHILMSYRDFWSGTVSKKYDWGELAADICIEGDIETFPKNALSNFVQGLRQKDKPPKFSIPAPERIEAIIRFLTDKNSKGYFCEKDHLLEPVKWQAAYFEQEWLDQSKDKISRFLKAEHLKGTYTGRFKEDGQDFDITLHFSSVIPGGAVHVYLHQSQARSLNVNAKEESYIGWATINDYDTVTVTLREQQSRHSVKLMTAGLDDGLYDAKPLNTILMFVHDEPEPGVLDMGKQVVARLEGAWGKTSFPLIHFTRNIDDAVNRK